MSYFLIKYRKNKKDKSYLERWVSIGPMFGATKKNAMRFGSMPEALEEIRRMPIGAGVFCEVVEIKK